MHLQGQTTEFDFSVVFLLVFLAGKFSLKTRSHMVATEVPRFPGVLKCGGSLGGTPHLWCRQFVVGAEMLNIILLN